MIVLDASALVDVVLGHPDSAWSLDRMGAEDVCAPAHQMAEVLSALARLRRAGVIDGAGAMTALAEAAAFPRRFLRPRNGICTARSSSARGSECSTVST